MELKNKQGKLITVMCANCKDKKALEDFWIDGEEAGMAYFCSEVCNLKFAIDYDFDEETHELLGQLCLKYNVYQHNDIIKAVLNEVNNYLSSKIGIETMQRCFGDQLNLLKKQLKKNDILPK